MMRFDRFTERAQDAAQRAAEIIQRYGHNQIDTEHILLALIEQPQGVIPQILEKLNIDIEALTDAPRPTCCAPAPRPTSTAAAPGQIFITPRVKRIIDLANEEANRLKDEYISTEHIFLAILSERNTAMRPPAGRGGDHQASGCYDAVKEIRGGQRVTDPQGRDPLPHAGEVLPRPDPAGQGRQAGPGHRPRQRNPARHPDPLAPHQEQPGADRRGRAWARPPSSKAWRRRSPPTTCPRS